MQLEDGEHLIEQLLLMQVVKLEGGIHPIDDGVLVDKSWKSCHDSLNERSGVREIIHNMRAGDHVVSAIHAVMESGDAVDMMIFTKVDSVLGDVMTNNPFVNELN